MTRLLTYAFHTLHNSSVMKADTDVSKQWQLGTLAALLAVPAYIGLALAAFLHYPSSYSPLTNALSQLGSPPLNPSGSVFYNLGGISLGLLLVPFYLSMNSWNTGDRSQKILTLGAQTAGIASSVALIISCIFPAGTNPPFHGPAAAMAMLTSIFFWVFSAFSMLKNPASVKWIPYFGYLPAISIGLLIFVLKQRFVEEWVGVGFFLIYVLLLTYNGRIMSKSKTVPHNNSIAA